jgi:tripartite-type tricarboxylate transporter receptor subunit TctC
LKLLTALTSALVLAAALPASAQDFPKGNITLIVGVSPGGSTDITARLIADPLSKALGKPVIVDNKPGASGNIGASQVARAKPDGHTLLVQYSGYHAANPHLFQDMGWAPKDFAPVAMATLAPQVIAVHPDVKATTLKELIELARAKPDQIKYGSAGNGSVQHMATELLAQMTGVKMVHVPYKGTAPALQDLLGGRIELLNTTPPPLLPYIRSGKLRALAYTGDKRHPALPEVPTAAEAGVPGYEAAAWFGFLAPAKTPPAVIERLAAEIRKIVEGEEYKRKMEEQGAFAVFKGPEEFAAYIDKDVEYWGKVIRTAGIKAD